MTGRARLEMPAESWGSLGQIQGLFDEAAEIKERGVWSARATLQAQQLK